MTFSKRNIGCFFYLTEKSRVLPLISTGPRRQSQSYLRRPHNRYSRCFICVQRDLFEIAHLCRLSSHVCSLKGTRKSGLRRRSPNSSHYVSLSGHEMRREPAIMQMLVIVIAEQNSVGWSAWFRDAPHNVCDGGSDIVAILTLIESYGTPEMDPWDMTKLDARSRDGHLEYLVPSVWRRQNSLRLQPSP